MDTPIRHEEQLFEAARHLKELTERSAYLDAACAGDSELRRAVERLLAADRKAEFFFAEGEAALNDSVAALASAERPGDCIGHYRLLQKIGEGGCGTVYMAEQEAPVRRRIALKIIKLGMDTRSVVARFEAERQALAMMDHANIARVFDAGATNSGRPYFVMELVRGVKMTEYCDDQRLTTHERLELFTTVCQAVHHAHQKGIIHRDLKPSNILVTINDGIGVPKVIDFGIAKAVQGRLTDQTLFTAFEQLLGTPAYMSPEQALMTSVDIDTRSDIYSLGVLLYELLTGKTPFDTQALLAGGIDQLRRTISEQEPIRPSTRLRWLPDEELTSAAQRRRAEAPKLLSGIRGDLDWIVMRCLEKDRARRYETANDLAMDIKRHLNNELIMARSPSTTYKLGKFIRRNRSSVIAGAALLLVLCFGLVGTTLGLIRVRAEARRARAAESAAKQDRDLANKARQQADQAQSDERRLNFQMAFERGLGLCDQGDIGSGMLWLTRALELAPPGEAAMQRVIRANLTAWQRELHILKGIYPQRQGVVAGAFSPDGTLVLTGAEDGAVRFWNRKTGVAEGAPLHHDAEVHTAVFSPNGECFLTTSIDKTARLWRTDTHQLIREFAHDSAVYGGLFTKDGRIVTSTSGGAIQVWDRDIEKPIDAWHGPTHGVHDLALSPDGKLILGACDNGLVLLWNLQTHQVIATFAGHTGRVPTAVFVRSDRIASADTDGNVFLWTWPQAEAPVNGQRIGKPYRHRGGVHRLRVSENGDQLLTASFDNQAQLLNSETGEPIGSPFEHHGALKSVAFGKDRSILTFCEGDAAREWQPAAGCLNTASFHRAGTEQAIFTPDAQYVLIRKVDKTASIRRVLTDEPVGTPFRPTGGIHGFAVSPDESKIMTGAADGLVQFWESATGLPVGETFQHSGGAWAVAISQDGALAVSGGLDGVVELWDARQLHPMRTLLALQNAPVRGVAFSPDSSRIAVASSDKLAWVVATHGSKVARQLKGHHGSVTTAAFSYDSKKVVTGSWDKSVVIWDAETGVALSKPMRHGGPFWYAVAFSGDGRTIVAGCDDHTVRIWDAATSRPIGPMLPHDAALRAAAFTKNDSQIITGTSVGTSYIWDVSRSPMEGDVASIALWLQVSTGMELRSDGELRPLDPDTWQQRRKRLDQVRRSPAE